MIEWMFKRVQMAVGFSIRALTIILSVCDTPPSITQNDALKVLMTNNNSVKNLIQYCSNGSFTFDTVIFPSYVNIPCPDSVTSCDVNGWADRADDAIRPFLPNVDDYIYRIYILPKGACTFAGLGAVGPCDSHRTCRSWISGHYAEYPIAYVHELGHNLGLGHASYNGNEYGDYSDLMGYCCIERCFNAPHSNMLHITKPKQTLSLPLSSTITLSLLQNEYIVIHDFGKKWYVQYRQASGLDKVPTLFSDSINIYLSSASLYGITTLNAMLKTANESSFHGQFTIKLVEMQKSMSTIEILPSYSPTMKDKNKSREPVIDVEEL
jgi:hypothetical protein